ncbi:MAG: MbtH family protein [Bacillus sp. (in: firmicutes)]
MYNPFEQQDAQYVVLVNIEDQYSLWPAGVDVPVGWSAVFGPQMKEQCQQFIEEKWVDMRPKSLRRAMDEVFIK